MQNQKGVGVHFLRFNELVKQGSTIGFKLYTVRLEIVIKLVGSKTSHDFQQLIVIVGASEKMFSSEKLFGMSVSAHLF